MVARTTGGDMADGEDHDHVWVAARGVRFPEGPVWADDATLVVTEIAAGTLSGVDPATGLVSVLVSSLPGPNGMARSPKGTDWVWVCDNGGYFTWFDTGSVLVPGPPASDHRGGSLRHLPLNRGAGEPLVVDRCDGESLVAPNDLVLDANGGVWFTDFGVQHDTEVAGRPGVGYLAPGANEATGVVWGTHQANGVGLSVDGSELYVAETHSGSLWAFDVVGPGRVADGGAPLMGHGGRLVHRAEGRMFDSLAVDPDGWVCVATIGPGGGVTCVHPSTGEVRHVTAPDDLTTNVCFTPDDGGAVRAALTLSSIGAVGVIADWRAVRDATPALG